MRIPQKIIFLLIFSLPLIKPFIAEAATFYVSRNGDGSSSPTSSFAATPWTELNSIAWTSIQPGDTILIDGGPIACPQTGDEWVGADSTPPCGMVYHTPLVIGASGSTGNPITIKLSSETGHNGTAIFEGNNTNFTYCTENNQVPMPAPPTTSSGSVLSTIVNFNDKNWIVLDGTHWGGLVMRNGTQYGVNLGNGDNNTLRFAKMHHNNDPADTTNSSNGLNLQGQDADNILVEHIEVYRNGQDAIRLAGDNVTLFGSYIHDTYCNHPDGIQSLVFTNNSGVGTAEQVVENLTIDSNIFFNIDLQSIFLGENVTHQSWNEGTRIKNNLFTTNANPATRYYIKTKNENSSDFIIENNTFHYSTEFGIEWCCAPTGTTGALAPMIVRNNIFMEINQGATAFFFDTRGGTTTYQNNCRYLSGGLSQEFTSTGEITSDPQFINPNRNPVTGNYGLQPGSPCSSRGSSITSLNQLLSLGAGSSTPTPASPSPTPTPASPTDSQIFEIENCQLNTLAGITAPFSGAVDNTYIYMPSPQTDPNLAGSAQCPFTIASRGRFQVDGRILTNSSASNSFFFNIGSLPETPQMIWDTPNTLASFTYQPVTWRGSGLPDSNWDIPQLFNLIPGPNLFTLRGREANAQIDKIRITLVQPLNIADLDFSGNVNLLDHDLLLADFNKNSLPNSDLNQNGQTDIYDFAILINNYN